MKKTRISRRKFMQMSFSCAAGAAVGMNSLRATDSLNNKIQGVSRTSLKSLESLVTTCKQCPAGCGIRAYLDGDKIVQILGNPSHPNNQGAICAKGIAGLNLVNDPERLLFPLKRKGPRGQGQWTRISWDEAYSLINRRLMVLQKEMRMQELVIDIGQPDPILSRFIDALGSVTSINRQEQKNLNRDLALRSMIGSSSLVEDVGHSRTIVNFGANPYANHERFVYIARQLVHAQMEQGARLVTFDVRLSETAAKSDEWHPIRPGTDGMLALAMAKVIVDKNLYNQEFFDSRTNISLSQLRQHLSSYTLAAAENETGASGAVIEQLATDFARYTPSIAMFGGGISDHENGIQGARCVSLLNWLIGNLGIEGGIFTPQDEPSPIEPKIDLSLKANTIVDINETQNRIDTYFVYMANPAYSDPNCGSCAQLLSDETRVPYLVVMDTHLSETAMYADLVLPAATYLESWGLMKNLTLDGGSVLSLTQPVVSRMSPAQVLRSPDFDVGKLLKPVFQPKGEAKEVGNLCLELSRRLKGSIHKDLPFKDTEAYVKQTLVEHAEFKIPSEFDIAKEQGQWLAKAERKIDSQPRTIEVYSQSLEAAGHTPLPEYTPILSHKDLGESEFILTPFKSNLWEKGTANSKWAREISHNNPLWMNKTTAFKLNIKNGEKVRIVSPVGTLIAQVQTTGRIHPASVAMAEGLGHSAVGKVAQAIRFKSTDLDTELIWWEKAGNGANPYEIIEARKEKIGGGFALKDTKVKIEKL